MEVILLERVVNLGGLGEVVNVRPGYGRNYLIPNGKAVPATPANRTEFEVRRAELEAAAAKTLNEAQARREALEGRQVVVKVRAGEEGKLFGSVGPADVAASLTDMGLDVQRREIRMHAGPIRSLGEHEVEIYLHPEVSAYVTVAVTAEE